MVHTQFSTPIRVLRADSAGEYVSHMLRGFLAKQGLMLRMAWLSASIATCLRWLVR
jgi:hypothetical protein